MLSRRDHYILTVLHSKSRLGKDISQRDIVDIADKLLAEANLREPQGEEERTFKFILDNIGPNPSKVVETVACALNWGLMPTMGYLGDLPRTFSFPIEEKTSRLFSELKYLGAHVYPDEGNEKETK